MAASERTDREVALVTGGTRGIGLGIARALAARGFALVVCGRRPATAIEHAMISLANAGSPVHYVRADVADARAREALVGEALSHFGRIDVLVNNAGRAPAVRADLLEATPESFDDVLSTNLRGPYFLTQAVARHFLEGGAAAGSARRGIVFVSSISAEAASINRGEYCVSKAGLAMATKLFATRLAPHGIPVFEVRPGIIDTDMTAGVRDLYTRRIADGLVPAGRWGTPDDVGRVVASLVSGDFQFATGSIIHVDGGLGVGRI